MSSLYSCGYRGELSGSLEPPVETKLFHFYEEFQAKSA